MRKDLFDDLGETSSQQKAREDAARLAEGERYRMRHRAGRLRDQADRLDQQVETKRLPMTQNPTPKRLKEHNQKRWEADNLERQARALRAVADALEAGTLPECLAFIHNRKDLERLVHKGLESGVGYYDVVPQSDYRDHSPEALALRALMDGTATPEQQAADAERQRAEAIRRQEDRLRFVDIAGFFPTPRPVIDKMLDLAGIRPGLRVLEPSAGKGDILDALRERGVTDLCYCEPSPVLVDILRAKGYDRPLYADFLECHGWTFDRVVMNPPFEKGQDMDHIRHAYEECLRDGGRLVAVMSDGPFYRQGKKAQEFRDWFLRVGGKCRELPEGAFEGPGAFRQTGVKCRLVVIEKGGAA